MKKQKLSIKVILVALVLLLTSLVNTSNTIAVSTERGVVSGLTIKKLDSTDKVLSQKTLSIGSSYRLVEAQNAYYNAGDASKRVNSVGTRAAGTYYIYKSYSNMFNLTKQKGLPGFWINPVQSQKNLLAQFPTTTTPTPTAPTSGGTATPTPTTTNNLVVGATFKLTKYVNNYVTANDAAKSVNSVGKKAPGTYYIYRIYNGMYNLTKSKGYPGGWVNLKAEGLLSTSTPTPKPAPTPTPTAPTLVVGGTYKLTKTVNNYVSSLDALNGRNAVGKKYPGTYYIYKIANGVYNLTTKKGSPGGWVNLNEAGSTTSPVTYPKVTVQGFVSATKLTMRSLNGTVKGTLKKGTYIAGKYSADKAWIEFSHYGQMRKVAAAHVEKLTQTSGWISRGGYTYYISSTNKQPVRGFIKIGGKQYYFDPMLRYMYKGVKNTGRNIYYFSNAGVLTTGGRSIYGTSFSQYFKFGSPTTYEANNGFLSKDERDYLGQAAINSAFTAIGTKYWWYGIDLKNGTYCSGLAYASYKENNITIPGPEYGNEAEARKRGAQSGPAYSVRGWGPAGDYGYQMVVAQYNKTDDYTGGTTGYHNGNYSLLLPGDLMFSRSKSKTHLIASHTAMYAGRLNGVHYTMHAGFVGNRLEPVSKITSSTGWAHTMMPLFQRPFK